MLVGEVFEMFGLWTFVLFETGMVFPFLQGLLLLRDGGEGFWKSPLWIYVPSVFMWYVFARSLDFSFLGIGAAIVGFCVGLWMWRVGDKYQYW